MNYNFAALACMILGVVFFYVALSEFSLIIAVIALAVFEVVAVLLFLIAEVNQRYEELDKRLRKLEEKES